MQSLASQSIDPNSSGIFIGKIYSDVKFSLNSTTAENGFELRRAYFGYQRNLNQYFSATVKLDVGSPDDISEFSRLRRYAYFKNACLEYSNGNLEIWAGLFDMLQFKVQEKAWGYRYLYRSYMDEYRFGPSADLGAGLGYRFNPKLSTDIILSNGEGYSSPQRDRTYKGGWGVTYNPWERFTIRSYYSVFFTEVPQMTLSGFANYHGGKWKLSAEYNHQFNYKFNKNRNLFGYSVYGTYIFSERFEFFIRYDQLYSNILPSLEIPWNLPNDGSALITGIQYTPLDNINIAVDYQDWVEYAGNGDKKQLLFIHLEVAF
jgi:hypothetical protein